MTNLDLTLGCWDYDRVTALIDGRVRPEGINLRFLNMIVEETFFRMLRHQEFDVSEMSMSSYLVSLTKPERPFVAISGLPQPVFPPLLYLCERRCRDKRAERPDRQTLWLPGIPDDRAGLDQGHPQRSLWRTGGRSDLCDGGGRKLRTAPRKSRWSCQRASASNASAPDDTLAQMLADGRIDAFHTARKPSTYDGVRVKRLFPDYVPVEQAYFRDTGIFPIMHVIAIRREVFEANRWIGMNLFQAFREAQRFCYDGLRETAALKGMLPWFNAHVEEHARHDGRRFLALRCRKEPQCTLDTFLRYHHEQGLSPRQLTVDEMFAPETLEEFVI